MKKRISFNKFIENSDNVKRILFLRNGLLGDLTATTSALYRLHKQFPLAEIDILTSPKSKDLLLEFPGVKNIFTYDFKYSLVSVIEQFNYFRKLSSKQYDILVINEVNPHYTYVTLPLKVKYRVGFTNKASFIFNYHNIRPHAKMALAEAATVKEWCNSVEEDDTYLFLSDEEIKDSRDILSQFGVSKEEKYAILHIGSNSYNSDRQWNRDYFIDLANYLNDEFGFKIVFTGVKHDEDNINYVRNKIEFETYSVAGKTNLRQFMGIINNAKIIIGPDTGIIHMAAAFNVPSIMIMGMSDKNDTGVYHPNGKAKIVTAGYDCIPCVHKNPKPKRWVTCEKTRPVLCMNAVTPQMVISSIDELLK